MGFVLPVRPRRLYPPDPVVIDILKGDAAMYYNRFYHSSLVRFKLMCEQWDAVKRGDLEVAQRLLHLLYHTCISVGLADDSGYQAECIAERCGCRVRYSRNYNVAHIDY